jgi:hypothetical protein
VPRTQVGGKDDFGAVDIVRKQVCIKDPKESENQKVWFMIQDSCQSPLKIREDMVKMEEIKEIRGD